MHVEVSVAMNFVISYLYNKLPRRRVDLFGDELEKCLKLKFRGHWYPDKPFKGSGFRCIPVNGEKADPIIAISANECGLDIEEVKGYLPPELTLWIDPKEVSYRIGEKGVVKILYSDKSPREEECYEMIDREIQAANKGFNPEAQSFKPIDSLSSSLTNLSISPSSPTPPGNGWSTCTSPAPASVFPNSTSPVPAAPAPSAANFLNRKSTAVFTTASFAATKFGSTKLKSQAKRPTRLSPTEFCIFMKNRSHNGGMHSPVTSPIVAPPVFPIHGAPPMAARPRTLSPRDARPDFIPHMESPQRMMPSPQQAPGFMGSMGDLYAPPTLAFNDMLPREMLPPNRGTFIPQHNLPSPDGPTNKAFLESLNLSSMYPANQFQHLLVAN